jgi:TPR repeat protein
MHFPANDETSAPVSEPAADADAPAVEQLPTAAESHEAMEPVAADPAAPTMEETHRAETYVAEEAGAENIELIEALPQAEAPDVGAPLLQPLQTDDDSRLLTPFERERHAQAAHLDEIARRLILPESALKEGTDAVISRLETRMKVLERSIAGLETRHSQSAVETDRKLKPVSELVTQLHKRADAAEDRMRQALAELRLHIHELKARQDTLDGGSRSAVAEMPVWPEPAPVEDVVSPALDEAVPSEEGPESDEADTQEENSRLAYLSAVRHSAKEGARQAAERENAEVELQNARRRRLMTAAGVAVVCLAVLGILFRFHPGAHGVSGAQSKGLAPAVVKAAPHESRSAVSRAPLDRLTELANRGDARAQLVIALKYLKGDGIAANDALAANWLERAAQAGDAIAQNHLGALYQAGRGVKQDVAAAMHWYESAAAQGDRHAMSNLAVLYAGGAGAATNFAEAARWFQRSASLGFVDAQFNLAVLFERGDGVPQSLLDAYKWYSIAAAAGDAVARTRADAIATQVSPDELQAARLAVANFKPQPMNRAANDEPTMAQVLAAR